MLTFNKNYFSCAILFFLIEVLIALFLHDQIIRPYIGDVLVVILIYCSLKSFLKLPVLTAALFVLLFSFGIEFLQYLNIVETLGLHKSKIARTVIGTSFSFIDLGTYVMGIFVVLFTEKLFAKNLGAQRI